MKSFTDLEQSKKLADILPLESADMAYLWHSTSDNPVWRYDEDMPPMVLGNVPINELTVDSLPCWSLAALLDVLPKGDYKDTNLCYGGLTINDYVDEWFCSYQQPEPMVMLHTHADNPLDTCYEMITKLHEQKLL